MTFNEALIKLNIEDYTERIFNSSSHGELLHLPQYIKLAEIVETPVQFRTWFIAVVDHAEKNWARPQSVYQHILPTLLKQKGVKI